MPTVINGQVYDQERSLYNLCDACIDNCSFTGPADGESALKETRNVTINNCVFTLRYPLWHAESFTLNKSYMSDTARAPIWYSHGGVISHCDINGIKCLRECTDISLEHDSIVSPEFGWKCSFLNILDTKISSEYLFFESKEIKADRLSMKGKYSFQYTENLLIENSDLDTKDAFWHSKNVTVINSKVKGEYLGWFSENLTLINCEIIGTQPFCYCENLKLEGCTMTECDLAFENSSVVADVKGHIDSVKNPHSGRIIADSVGEIVKDSVFYSSDAEIIIRH